jgi:hypothetical protein
MMPRLATAVTLWVIGLSILAILLAPRDKRSRIAFKILKLIFSRRRY